MIHQLATSIARSALSIQLQEHVWIVPAFQSIHILAIAALLFSAVAVSAEMARGRAITAPQPWIAGAFGWTWIALAVLLLSGAVLIGAEPVRSLMNLFFRIKVALVIAAAAATLLLQYRLSRREPTGTVQRVALAVVPVALWVAIIFCGRLIAYFGDLTA